MKSHKFFRTLVCSFAAVLAVACYDDDRLWDEITDVRNELSTLESRIDSLEQVVADNVTALQSMVSVGSIQSWTYNAETGKGVITLIDGSKITISQDIKGYSIITIEKDENGNYYWALCVDGENLPLMIDNKKVPVSVTPALKISDDNEWLISVDGGQTWVNTGISYYFEEPSEEDTETPDTPVVPEVAVFESAEVDGDNLILTLVGGTQIKVAIVGEAMFKAAEDALWFSRENLEKSVALETNNVKAFTVTEKPEGWKVSVEESFISVTSPVNLSYYPSEGTVKIFVLFDNGALPEILSLDVAYEPMFTLARANGSVTVTLSEHTGEDFTGYVLTSWEKSSYTTDAVVAKLNADYESLTVLSGTKTYTLDEIIENFDKTKEYVVAAVPYLPANQVAQGAMKYNAFDVQSIETIAEESDWTISNLKFDSADLKAVMPVPQYYGGFSTKELWDSRGKEDYIEILNEESGVLMDVITYEGPANGFPTGEITTEIEPATEYVIWYVPVDAKENDLYTENSFVEFTFTTPDVVADASIAAPTYVVSDVTAAGFTADVTPAANAYKTYAAIVKSTVIAEMTDADIVRYLIGANQYSKNSDVNTITKSSFDASDEVYLLAVSVTEDGKFGQLVKEVVALKELVFTDDLGVEVTDVEYDSEGNVTLSLSFKGSPVSMTYMAATYTFYTDDVLQSLMAKQQLGDMTKTVEISKIGGKITITGLEVGQEHTFYAVVSDAEGNFSKIYSTYTFIPTVQVEYVLSDDPDYEYGMPEITGKLTGSSFPKTYTMTVDMPETCKKYWLFCGDSEYFDGDAYLDTDKMVTMGLELSGETAHEESVSLTYEIRSSIVRIYMVWQDDKGRCHVIYTHNPTKK
ncbi:MAG: hypothetical protein IKV75_00170 [Bacteroidales bacterium]|nr:hypothetical protein [Bacteroidales bacterium]